MLVYVDACSSSSMFDGDLPPNINGKDSFEQSADIHLF